jgi:hypothetical protein
MKLVKPNKDTKENHIKGIINSTIQRYNLEDDVYPTYEEDKDKDKEIEFLALNNYFDAKSSICVDIFMV